MTVREILEAIRILPGRLRLAEQLNRDLAVLPSEDPGQLGPDQARLGKHGHAGHGFERRLVHQRADLILVGRRSARSALKPMNQSSSAQRAWKEALRGSLYASPPPGLRPRGCWATHAEGRSYWATDSCGLPSSGKPTIITAT